MKIGSLVLKKIVVRASRLARKLLATKQVGQVRCRVTPERRANTSYCARKSVTAIPT